MNHYSNANYFSVNTECMRALRYPVYMTAPGDKSIKRIIIKIKESLQALRYPVYISGQNYKTQNHKS